MGESSYEKGLAGERLAVDYLQTLGIKTLCTRYRAGRGEVDIVALDGDVLCFVEVKHRPEGRLGSGALSLDRDKRERLQSAAKAYLDTHRHPPRWRFDTIEITRAGIWYLRDAARLIRNRG